MSLHISQEFIDERRKPPFLSAFVHAFGGGCPCSILATVSSDLILGANVGMRAEIAIAAIISRGQKNCVFSKEPSLFETLRRKYANLKLAKKFGGDWRNICYTFGLMQLRVLARDVAGDLTGCSPRYYQLSRLDIGNKCRFLLYGKMGGSILIQEIRGESYTGRYKTFVMRNGEGRGEVGGGEGGCIYCTPLASVCHMVLRVVYGNSLYTCLLWYKVFSVYIAVWSRFVYITALVCIYRLFLATCIYATVFCVSPFLQCVGVHTSRTTSRCWFCIQDIIAGGPKTAVGCFLLPAIHRLRERRTLLRLSGYKRHGARLNIGGGMFDCDRTGSAKPKPTTQQS